MVLWVCYLPDAERVSAHIFIAFEKDEESEQMQGLRNDNARPWAESIARQIVSNNSEIV